MLLVLLCTICKETRADYDVPYGFYPERWTFYKIYADGVNGDVADATVSSATTFSNDELGWMLANLKAETTISLSSASINSASNQNQEIRINYNYNNKSPIGHTHLHTAITDAVSAGDWLTQYLSLSPSTVSRNEVTAQNSGTIPLRLKGAPGQTVNLFQIWSNTGILDRVNASGYLGILIDPVYPLDVFGAIRIGSLAGDGVDGVAQWNGSDFVGWKDGGWVSFTAGGSGAATGFVSSITKESIGGRISVFSDPTTIRGYSGFTYNNSLGVLSATSVDLDYAKVANGINSTTISVSSSDLAGEMNAKYLQGYRPSDFLRDDTLYFFGGTGETSPYTIEGIFGMYPVISFREGGGDRRKVFLQAISTNNHMTISSTIDGKQYAAIISIPDVTVSIGNSSDTSLVAEFPGYNCYNAVTSLWRVSDGQLISASKKILSSTTIQINTTSPYPTNGLIVSLKTSSATETVPTSNPAEISTIENTPDLITFIYNNSTGELIESGASFSQSSFSLSFIDTPSSNEYSVIYLALKTPSNTQMDSEYIRLSNVDGTGNGHNMSGLFGNNSTYYVADLISANSISVTDTISTNDMSIADTLNLYSGSIVCSTDLILQANQIIPKNVIQFDDVTGQKINFYSTSYAIKVLPFILGIQSDRYIYLGSDTNTDSIIIDGDTGNLQIEGDLTTNLVTSTEFNATTLTFEETVGTKIFLYPPAYSIGISPFDLDFTSDLNFKFHSDTVQDLMIIYGDAGNVAIKNDLTWGGVATGDGSGITNLNLSWSELTDSPSTVITAGDYMDWSDNTLNVVPIWLNLNGSNSMTGDLDMDGHIIQDAGGLKLTQVSSLSGLQIETLYLYIP